MNTFVRENYQLQNQLRSLYKQIKKSHREEQIYWLPQQLVRKGSQRYQVYQLLEKIEQFIHKNRPFFTIEQFTLISRNIDDLLLTSPEHTVKRLDRQLGKHLLKYIYNYINCREEESLPLVRELLHYNPAVFTQIIGEHLIDHSKFNLSRSERETVYPLLKCLNFENCNIPFNNILCTLKQAPPLDTFIVRKNLTASEAKRVVEALPKNLKSLMLSDAGPHIFSTLTRLKKLEDLFILSDELSFSDETLTELSAFTRLELLHISEALEITGELFRSLRGAKNLSELYLPVTKESDHQAIGHDGFNQLVFFLRKKLSTLELSGRTLEGLDGDLIKQMGSLEKLILSDCYEYEETILEGVVTLQKLIYIDLSGSLNEVIEEEVVALLDKKSLETVVLYEEEYRSIESVLRSNKVIKKIGEEEVEKRIKKLQVR